MNAHIFADLQQGTSIDTDDGLRHISEYPAEAGVYLNYMQALPTAVAEIKPGIAVTCGGHTQQLTPLVSEAESVVKNLHAESWPPGKPPIAVEDLSTDTSENVFLACMTARLALEGVLQTTSLGASDLSQARLSRAPARPCPIKPTVPFGRVTLRTCWRPKMLRLSLIAEALGLRDYRIIAFADACNAQAHENLAAGEAKEIAAMVGAGGDWLQLRCGEPKRRRRYQKSDAEYKSRFDKLRGFFPDTFAALELVRLSPESIYALQEAFRKEVVG